MWSVWKIRCEFVALALLLACDNSDQLDNRSKSLEDSELDSHNASLMNAGSTPQSVSAVSPLQEAGQVADSSETVDAPISELRDPNCSRFEYDWPDLKIKTVLGQYICSIGIDGEPELESRGSGNTQNLRDRRPVIVECSVAVKCNYTQSASPADPKDWCPEGTKYPPSGLDRDHNVLLYNTCAHFQHRRKGDPRLVVPRIYKAQFDVSEGTPQPTWHERNRNVRDYYKRMGEYCQTQQREVLVRNGIDPDNPAEVCGLTPNPFQFKVKMCCGYRVK
jgi:hypothetical protein